MNAKGPLPLFVERQTYRRRRMMDAARLLPILGIALFCMPLLWGSPNGEAASTATVMVYLFGIWALLAALSALISGPIGQTQGRLERPQGEAG